MGPEVTHGIGWIWLAFMVVFIVSPVLYGWGLRGWGPPYPSYHQQRRAKRAAAAPDPGGFDHTVWGRRGDLVWGMLILGVLCAFIAPFFG
jgi:hypothetical protein